MTRVGLVVDSEDPRIPSIVYIDYGEDTTPTIDDALVPFIRVCDSTPPQVSLKLLCI